MRGRGVRQSEALLRAEIGDTGADRDSIISGEDRAVNFKVNEKIEVITLPSPAGRQIHIIEAGEVLNDVTLTFDWKGQRYLFTGTIDDFYRKVSEAL